MRASSIQRKLRDLNVPIEKARSAAERYGDDAGTPTDMEKLQKAIRKAARQKLVEQHRREFRTWCKANGIPNPTHELQFAKVSHRRNWRFDWAWPGVLDGGVALEINGGIWREGGGAHTGKGHLRDMEKLNAAQSLGWRVVQVTPQDLYTEQTARCLKQLLDAA